MQILGTKSNYYVENSMNYEVSSLTRDGVLRATLTLEYKNNSEQTHGGGL